MGQFSRVRPGRRTTALALGLTLLLQTGAAMAQPTGDLVIHNGLIINANGRMAADVRISGEKIVEIAPKIVAAPGAREIDATGKFLMPGIIDTHTHMPLDASIPPTAKGNQDNIITGGMAALAGGVTLLGDFIAIQNNEDPNEFADKNAALIRKYSLADVYIHASVRPKDTPDGTPPDPLTQQKTFDALAARGIVSTGEDGMNNATFNPNITAWMKLFRASGQAGVVSMMHAEDYDIMHDAQDRLATMNQGTGLTIKNFPASSPMVAEVIAIQRSMAFAEATGAPIFILHLTSGRALKVIEDAQKRGLLVYCETRPWNLFGTELGYQQPNGGIYVGGPPLRSQWDTDQLWDGIRRGVIDTIGTDHTAFSLEAKLDPTQTILDKRMGQNTIQDYPTMMMSEGVNKGRVSLEEMVAVTSTNAAKIFGMYPRKGVIAVGSDADIVIWDPVKKKILNNKDQLSKAGYSTYAGKEVTGIPITTIRRGEIVWDNGKILAKPGSGQFIPGAPFKRPTLRPLDN